MILPLVTSGCIISENSFWHSVLLYNSRPNLINNRLIGAHTLYFYKVNFTSQAVKISELFTRPSILYEIRKLAVLDKESLSSLVRNVLEPYDKNVTLKEINVEEFNNAPDGGIFISVKLLLSKMKTYKDCIEITIFNKDKNVATFIAVADNDRQPLAPPFQYRVELMNSGHMRIVIEDFEDAESSSAEWLADKLFLKLVKWANEDNRHILIKPSASLIPIDKYTKLYRELKEKYGTKMVQIWPENTDPLKFVYEDIAIATYLICLWNEIMPNRKPCFVDLGCGNGLLVYILQEEGYPGMGIDVRKRKIWDMYPSYINLQEKTILPSDDFLFPVTDWIIGNHSDELTPWIPVITARSNFRANFFLLPCCSYDFDGRKYSRMNTNKSQYSDYLDYIEHVSDICGFVISKDKLRIPSTKKLCLVSTSRNYDEDQFTNINQRITNFIAKRCQSMDKSNWCDNVVVRSDKEVVRNCTKLDKELIERIIKNIVCTLLMDENSLRKPASEDLWNAGVTLSFTDIIKRIDSLDLKRLKKECGGIQTLMRNHRYIFDLTDGKIKLRIPPELKNVDKYKSKPCWFLKNHPQGCLNDSYHCAYKH